MASTAIYGVFVFLAWRRDRRRTTKLSLALGAVALVALIAFSRLILGVHYLSDVLGGASVGFAWLMLCLLALELRRARAGGSAARLSSGYSHGSGCPGPTG
jgi:membrane-associated phospholipid phosphatase